MTTHETLPNHPSHAGTELYYRVDHVCGNTYNVMRETLYNDNGERAKYVEVAAAMITGRHNAIVIAHALADAAILPPATAITAED